MWSKWVQLAALAGLTCLMRATVGEANQAEEGSAIALELLDECRAVAGAYDALPGEKADAAMRGRLTDKSSTLSASMLRDVERGGPIEGEHVIGDMIRRGREKGIATPLLRVVLAHLQAYEARRKRTGLVVGGGACSWWGLIRAPRPFCRFGAARRRIRITPGFTRFAVLGTLSRNAGEVGG